MLNEPIKLEHLKRINVIGTSCSGKTTLAKNLAQVLSVKHIELDSINWLPDWVERPNDEFRSLVEKEVAADAWALDGNYSRSRDIVWKRATAIIWLNYSFPLVAYRALSRTTRRVFFKETLYSQNRETFGKAFLSKDSILLWVLTSYHRRRRDYPRLLQELASDERKIFVFQNPNQTDEFLLQVKKQIRH
ncbi:MAG: adenylate kinase [Acidobacteria bacterium]|nr:adenylate kinase [Acidobacteriota bacterium]MCA1638339.1 adenylate kinase [Acidobacteriota bacterium]